MSNQVKKINNFDDVVINISKWMRESDSAHIYVLTDSAQKSIVERELLTRLLQEQKQDDGSYLPFATMQISVETPDSLAIGYLDGKDEVAINEELTPLKRIELVKASLHDHLDDLKAFKKSAKRYGFVTQLANLFEQFEDDGVTSADLEALTHKALGDGLVSKLNDVLVVFTDFENKVKLQKLSTRASKLAKLAEFIQAKNNDDFKNSHVAIVNFANPCGMEKQLFKTFENVAASTIELESVKYDKAKELSSKRNTCVVTADDTDLEAKWVANEISNLVTDSEHPERYRDIAVYVPSFSSDEAISLANNLDIAKIKYSMAAVTDLNSLPLAAFMRALLSDESNWFDINNINQLLHSELLVSSEQENINDYRRMVSRINARMVSAKIVSEDQWNNPKEWDDRRFEYDEDGKKVYKDNQLVYQDGQFMLKDGSLSLEFSVIRNQILSLHNLVKSLDDTDTSKVVKELMEGLEKYKILESEHEFYKRINAKAHANNSSNLSSRLKEGRERFDKVMTATLSNDIKDWRMELRNAFTTAFAVPYKLDQPETLDKVRVLSLMDAQLPVFKYAFVMGSNEDNYPGKLNASGIWSIDDQKILREQLEKLTADDLTHHEMVKDSFARAVISATKGTYLSFAKSDSAGEEHTLSKLVNDFVQDDQTSIQVTLNGINSEGKTSQFLVPDFNLQSQISKLRQKQENQESIDGQIKVANKEQFKNLYGLLGRQNEPTPLNKVMADKLYFKDGKLKVSFSSIEKYFENPYEYFLKYGLKIAEPEKQQFGANNAGTYVHALLQHSMDGYSSENNASNLVEKGINEVKKDENRQTQDTEMMLEATAQTKQYKYRLQSTVKRYLNQSLPWLQNANQKPVLEEFDLANFPEKKRTIKIDDDHSIVFTGRIDRVDLVTLDDISYLVVIDYKTGDTNNKLKNYTDKLDKGLQMQLPGYVWALEKNIDSLKEILGLEESTDLKFGAAVYAGVNDKDEGSKSSNSAYFKGIITNDYLDALGGPKSLKDKGYDPNDKLLIEINDIANETDVFEKNVKTFGNALIDGEQPKIEPYQLGEENGLSFSRYTQIVGFDEEMGNQYNEIIVEKDSKNKPEEK